MGDKATARETMKKAGVPTVPGSEGLIQVIWLFSQEFHCFFLFRLVYSVEIESCWQGICVHV